MKIQQFKYNYRGQTVWGPAGISWITIDENGCLVGHYDDNVTTCDLGAWISGPSMTELLGNATGFGNWKNSLEYVGGQ